MRYEHSAILKTLILGAFALMLLTVFTVRPFRSAISGLFMDFFFPYMKIPAEVESKAKKSTFFMKSKIALVSDIEKLHTVNLALAARTADTSMIENENRQLRAILKIRERSGFKPVSASIIGRDPVLWDRIFAIDKGSDDGVVPGALVLAPVFSDDEIQGAPILAAAGRVKSVSARSAIVSSLMDDECKLSVRLPESASAGIVSGGQRRGKEYLLKLLYLPKDVSYRKDEPVFTSGFTDNTPPAFFAGRLSGNDSDIKIRDNLYKEAVIVSPVNFSEIDFVIVMTKKRGE